MPPACFLHPLTWGWEPTEGIGVLPKIDGVVIVFRARNWPRRVWTNPGPARPDRVDAVRIRAGGRRPWFRCEAYPNGKYCGRRVAILYSGGEHFACRHCFRLAYESQNETPYLRAVRRTRKIRMRLGAGFSYAEPFPDKPPRMHWRTYLRMRVAAGESIAMYEEPWRLPARRRSRAISSASPADTGHAAALPSSVINVRMPLLVSHLLVSHSPDLARPRILSSAGT